MGSTFPSTLQQPTYSDPAPAVIAWRSWPLVDHARWSWAVVACILGIAAAVWHVSASWILAVLATAAVTVTMWQFFAAVWYEISPLGLRCKTFGRSRLLAWHIVRSYQLRPTGVVLYRRGQPAPLEVMRSVFMPYPPDADEAILALRAYLPHAVELPTPREAA
jgi:hypothetical protein